VVVGGLVPADRGIPRPASDRAARSGPPALP